MPAIAPTPFCFHNSGIMEIDDALAALAALSHRHRLRAFRALVEAGEEGLAVGALREQLALPAATLSAHLNTLRRAGLVHDQRLGRVILVSADFARMRGLVDFLTENCCGGRPCTPTPRRSNAQRGSA